MRRLKTVHHITELSDTELTRLKGLLEVELSSTELALTTLQDVARTKRQEIKTINRLLATPSSVEPIEQLPPRNPSRHHH